jgi:glycerate kinase
LEAELVPGVDLVLRSVGFDQKVAGADLVLTGEGSLDTQTPAGKTPWGVGLAARRAGVPVIAFGGRVEPAAERRLLTLFEQVVPIWDGQGTLADALKAGAANLEAAVAATLTAR